MKEFRAELTSAPALPAQTDSELHAIINSRVDAALAEAATAATLGSIIVRKLAAELKESLYKQQGAPFTPTVSLTLLSASRMAAAATGHM